MTARGVGQWKRNKDSAAFVIAHELGHTLCQNHLAPSWRDSDAHIGDGSDLMGVSGRAHCPGVPDDAEQVRLDCDKDDTWGPLTLTTHETWVVQRWSTFNSAYLWGAPKPTDPGYYSVTAIGFDFCPGGPPGWCRE